MTLPVAVLLDNVRSMYNVGAFFRTADGVDLQELCLCGITAHPPKKAISKTALGAEETVPWTHEWDPVHRLEIMRGQGFQIAAIETGADAQDLFEWQPVFPVCVVFGHEVDGLNPELLARADVHVRIPMHGSKKSLNVATAGGVVLYELLRKWRELSLSPTGGRSDALPTVGAQTLCPRRALRRSAHGGRSDALPTVGAQKHCRPGGGERNCPPVGAERFDPAHDLKARERMVQRRA